MNIIKKILPHIIIIFSLIFITFTILDICNPMVNYLSNNISRTFLIIFCIVGLVNGIGQFISYRKSSQK